MNRIILLFALCITLTGCQKAVNDAPVTASDAPVEQTAPVQAESDTRIQDAIPSDSGRMVLSFDELGLDESRLKPAFASSVLTKNGVFALLNRGNIRYYLVSENDDAISESQYREYCASVLSYIQSISDNGDVWNYDVNINQKLDKAVGTDSLGLSDIMGLTYDIGGKAHVLYVRYHKYKEGTFVDIKQPVNAVNVSAWILD